MPLGMEVGLGPGDFVLDGDPAPLPILLPMYIVAKRLDGSRWHLAWSCASAQATLCNMVSQLPLKGAQPPVFGPCRLWPNGRMDEDATWHRRKSRPRPHCVRRGPSSPPRKRHSNPTLFSTYVYCGHGRPSQLLLSSCFY